MVRIQMGKARKNNNYVYNIAVYKWRKNARDFSREMNCARAFVFKKIFGRTYARPSFLFLPKKCYPQNQNLFKCDILYPE